MLKWIVGNRIVNMYKNRFGINDQQWLMCNKTKPNQHFGNVRWLTILDCEMPSSPDTFRVLLVRFTSVAESTTSDSTLLGLRDFVWSARFLKPDQNFLKHLVTAPEPSDYCIVINDTKTYRKWKMFLITSATLWLSSNS